MLPAFSLARLIFFARLQRLPHPDTFVGAHVFCTHWLPLGQHLPLQATEPWGQQVCPLAQNEPGGPAGCVDVGGGV